MSFVSLEFVLLFCIVVPLYVALPYRFGWPVLLAASYVFYMYWKAEYLLLLLATTVCDYLIARAIDARDDSRARKALLVLSLSINLGVLFVFKYFNFFSASLAHTLDQVGVSYQARALDVLLPVGISFYTFQEMAYVIDVYRRRIRAERRFWLFSLFITFFPQLVAGPIERAGNLLPQFRRKQPFDEARVVEGLRLILWGFFKKVVIADRLAIYVNEVYGAPAEYSGPVLATATVFFAFQIYCDFSAYSDIAIGTARVLGFRLMVNFRQPYFAASIQEFWQRWHVSLSTWFRDYLYVPLGGNRVSAARWRVNIMTVFLLSGLWHGANWTFLIWGALHGAYIVIGSVVRQWAPLAPHGAPAGPVLAIGRVALTFLLVCVSWIFFRAATVADAWLILTGLFSAPDGLAGIRRPMGAQGGFELSLLLIGVLLLVDLVDARIGLQRVLEWIPRPMRWATYYAAAMVIFSLGIWGHEEFIYFQF